MKSNRNDEQGKDSVLKKFLASHREAESKKVPPTATEALLMTMLVGNEPLQKQQRINMRISQLSTEPKLLQKANARSDVDIKNITGRMTVTSSKPVDTNRGLWSRVNIQDEKTETVGKEKSIRCTAANGVRNLTTLDDVVDDRGRICRPVSVHPKDHSNKPLSNLNRRKRNLNTMMSGVWSQAQNSSSCNHRAAIEPTKPKDRRLLIEKEFHKDDEHIVDKPSSTVNAVRRAESTVASSNLVPVTFNDSAQHAERFISTSCQMMTAKEKQSTKVKDESTFETPCAEPTHQLMIEGKPSTTGTSFHSSPSELEPENKESLLTSKTSRDDTQLKNSQKNYHRGNFVRLNLRNRAGACRGAKNLKRHNRLKRRRIEESQNRTLSDPSTLDQETIQEPNRRSVSLQTVIDPIDDFLDGTFHNPVSSSLLDEEDVPVCTRHNLPCKLVTVKKASSGNKGRRFYACALPQYEACNFFQWEDDTIQAAQKAIEKESHHPYASFIGRQSNAFKLRFKVLGVPELRREAKKRLLPTAGDKELLLNRLVDWATTQVKQNFSQELSSLNRLTLTAEEEGVLVDSKSLSYSVQVNPLDTQYNDNDNGSMEEELEFIDSDISSDTNIEFEDDVKEITDESDRSCARKSDEDVDFCLRSHLKKYFGFSEFRDGQEWAVRRCLENKRSLFVAPTGLGKSLSYVLPAALMDGLCIVVSPLISLMEDQIRRLHPSITASSLSGNLSSSQMALIIEDLVQKRLKILFISPERLLSPAFRRLLKPTLNDSTNVSERKLPTVSLLCIDEAHCMSQWGHNFRPSYLRLQHMLKTLQPKSILALTATAGPPVIKDICHSLGINPNEGGVQVVHSDRKNIDVSAHFVMDEVERMALLTLILRKSRGPTAEVKRYDPSIVNSLSSGSVIIYVWRKKDAENIFEQLSGYEDLGKVVCYHGGMTAADRASSQNKFMRGKARICVATVAFGMGIDKEDVSGVVHMYLPSSPENFVQEIGRAGRSGQKAKAIAIVTSNDFIIKHSLSYSESISISQIKGLLNFLRTIIGEALTEMNAYKQNISDYLDISVPVDALVEAIDIKEESIMTILSYLESESLTSSKSLLMIEGKYPDRATVVMKRQKIDKLAVLEPVFASIQKGGMRVDQSHVDSFNGRSQKNDFAISCGTAYEMGFASYGLGTYSFSVVKCARILGRDTRQVYATLRRFEKSGDIELRFDSKEKQCFHLKINSDGLRVFENDARINLDLVEGLSQSLWRNFSKHDKVRTSKVESMYEIMVKLDVKGQLINNPSSTEEPIDLRKSFETNSFSHLISDYFNRDPAISFSSEKQGTSCNPTLIFPTDDLKTFSQLSTDISSILSNPSSLRNISSSTSGVHYGMKSFEDYTVLATTKILHGIETPRFNMQEWFSHPIWAKYRTYNFESLMVAVSSHFSAV